MNNKDNKLIFEAYDGSERAFQRSMGNDIRTRDADDRAERRIQQEQDSEAKTLDNMSQYEIDMMDREDAASMPESHIGYSVEQTCHEIKKNRGVVYAISGGDGTYGVFTNINDALAIEEETRGTVYEVPLNEYLPEGELPVEM